MSRSAQRKTRNFSKSVCIFRSFSPHRHANAMRIYSLQSSIHYQHGDIWPDLPACLPAEQQAKSKHHPKPQTHNSLPHQKTIKNPHLPTSQTFMGYRGAPPARASGLPLVCESQGEGTPKIDLGLASAAGMKLRRCPCISTSTSTLVLCGERMGRKRATQPSGHAVEKTHTPSMLKPHEITPQNRSHALQTTTNRSTMGTNL